MQRLERFVLAATAVAALALGWQVRALHADLNRQIDIQSTYMTRTSKSLCVLEHPTYAQFC